MTRFDVLSSFIDGGWRRKRPYFSILSLISPFRSDEQLAQSLGCRGIFDNSYSAIEIRQIP
ncbi:MAG: hypothetical protein CMQ28_06270 [Gammaproteobacteria bacterium]|nr:hypothetical protein [Gammaproteobacteria bacterium]